jgi:CheY-like chemotaxis protein
MRSLQVLVVEDNPDDIRILRRALSRNALVLIAHIARDGQEALNYLLHEGEYKEGDPEPPPDLILLDLNLPRVNGIEVLKRVRSSDSLSSIPVVMFTSSSREEDVTSSYKSGTNTYIQKPVEFEDYQRAIAVLEEYWAQHARLPTSGGI